MDYSASFWIQHLQLSRHVEGGSFKEVYRSPLKASKDCLPQTFRDTRNFSTSIYFLLEQGQFSAFHRIASDELWHFYFGHPLTIYEIEPNGKLIVHKLGNNPVNNESFQCVIKAGSWFASEVEGQGLYSLVGCTVSPGFDFEDFELADCNKLSQQFPEYAHLIRRLCRD
jgi:hypothetical protein